jgi:hydroxymethylpyrimidine pyrophosphatase-like HAD family hydrolase
MLIEPLSIKLPIGAFSGGMMVGPNLEVIEQHLVPAAAARRGVEVLAAFGADAWVFTAHDWLLCDPHGDYVALEKRTIQAEPSVVADFEPFLARAAKIVGSSKDFTRLAECEVAMRETLQGRASVARSQSYYLCCVTASNADDGFAQAIERYIVD